VIPQVFANVNTGKGEGYRKKCFAEEHQDVSLLWVSASRDDRLKKPEERRMRLEKVRRKKKIHPKGTTEEPW